MRWVLPVIAVASAALGVALGFGYVGRIGVGVSRWRPGGSSPRFMSVDVDADGGQVDVQTITTDTAIAGVKPGLHVSPVLGQLTGLPPLDARPFYVHTFNLISVGQLNVAAVPIWCAEVPCLIAPLLWVRRRRKRRRAAGRGFAVVTPAGADPVGPTG